MRHTARLRILVPALFGFAGAIPAAADVTLAGVFTDHMVLQAGAPCPVWGTATPGEHLAVHCAGERVETVADGSGHWRVDLPALEVSDEPRELVVEGSSRLVVSDVLVGEVWLCSGQSNMVWRNESCARAEEEVAAADFPRLRMFTFPRTQADEPSTECKGEWVVCSPQTAAKFSAVAYHFGRELLEDLDRPVGLVVSAWGGTVCEAWTRRGALEGVDELAYMVHEGNGRKAQNRPSVLYNGMIRPLIPFSFAGAIWYQGEANVSRAWEYRTLFPTMIESWRTDWGSELPFYFVQLAPFRYHARGRLAPEACAELREAQALAQALPRTGMAVTMDIGNPDDIHPRNKRDVGRRLALWALARDYGRDVECSGPVFRSLAVTDDSIRLSFAHAEGLRTRDGEAPGVFEVAGMDRLFHAARARIEGGEVVVRSAKVALPVAVRYGWRDDAQPNLENGAGLPAVPFRTDDWPGVTWPASQGGGEGE
ncbi:MAG: sialate O-acetylesterase [Planctomycetota bacterium]|jgi:sialate O-acetylesterase|nr:sialate O-acetylesterase [Planctomycetota bacterium]MDP6762302.1 sialate O-acetylesterase [Planctomycetota bacterium]MDP6990310.1 sialate O-acetylesterase [Planctomycetota bacterium]